MKGRIPAERRLSDCAVAARSCPCVAGIGSYLGISRHIGEMADALRYVVYRTMPSIIEASEICLFFSLLGPDTTHERSVRLAITQQHAARAIEHFYPCN